VAFDFEKLIVYQKAVDFADNICVHTEQFARGYGFLADQLNRAALSISNNTAEGTGRFTKADRRHFFGISRGPVQECVPVLVPARRGRLITNADHASPKGTTGRNRPNGLGFHQRAGQSRGLKRGTRWPPMPIVKP
jgi:four helix bundle protein